MQPTRRFLHDYKFKHFKSKMYNLYPEACGGGCIPILRSLVLCISLLTLLQIRESDVVKCAVTSVVLYDYIVQMLLNTPNNIYINPLFNSNGDGCGYGYDCDTLNYELRYK